jgi:hypothetical protein
LSTNVGRERVQETLDSVESSEDIVVLRGESKRLPRDRRAK